MHLRGKLRTTLLKQKQNPQDLSGYLHSSYYNYHLHSDTCIAAHIAIYMYSTS